MDLFKPEPWMAEALCAQTDAELWFPERGGSPSEAKRICAQCPVLDSCRAFAVENQELGIWGGTSEKQRRSIRVREAAA